ncbi:MAG: hypothetical protein EP336_03945 [Rhodobacteraceae bacterium]|nr:MAG: hypothetical protein EP336_03945 [Paracoccaceae bacterium]
MVIFEIWSGRFTRFVFQSFAQSLTIFSLITLGVVAWDHGLSLEAFFVWFMVFFVGLGLAGGFGFATWIIGAPVFYLVRRTLNTSRLASGATAIAGAALGLVAWGAFVAVFGMDLDVFASGEVTMLVLLAMSVLVGAINGANYQKL